MYGYCYLEPYEQPLDRAICTSLLPVPGRRMAVSLVFIDGNQRLVYLMIIYSKLSSLACHLSGTKTPTRLGGGWSFVTVDFEE